LGLSLTIGYKKQLPDFCEGLSEEDEEWTDDCYEGVGDWESVEHFYDYGYHTLMVIREYVAHVDGIDDLEMMPAYVDSMTLFKYRPGLAPPMGDWENYPGTLKPFFLHSDCDGFWTNEECKQIYPRLQEIYNNAPKWLNRYEAFGKLVYGIRKAAELGYDIRFA
jgi:hypothetical protein